MADEKIINEQLTDEQLENVAGGTGAEFRDIYNALAKDPAFKARLDKVPNVPFIELTVSGIAKGILRDKMGIEADIDIAVLGSGEGPNYYYDLRNGGAPMTHQQVLDRINAYVGKG